MPRLRRQTRAQFKPSHHPKCSVGPAWIDYDILFRNNCGKVGLLSPQAAARIVRFYHLVSSVVEDINLLQDANGDLRLKERYRLNTPAGNLAFHEEMRQLSREAFNLGSELVQEPSS